jgi:rod shape-determining protein MreC
MIVLLLAAAGAVFFTRGGIRSFARETVYPFSNLSAWFDRTVARRARAVWNRARLAPRIASLEDELAGLRLMAAEADAQADEIRQLRKILEFPPPASSRFIAAPVVSRGGTSAVWQNVRLGKGELHGIRRGDVVVVPDGVVGRVTDVSLHTSEVRLLTDPNSRVACELDVPPDEQLGVVRGILYGGGVKAGAAPSLSLLYVIEPLRLRFLAREFEPPPRTRVVTSGLGQTFPKGLTVGYLLSSQVPANGLTREAEVVPAVDFAALETVFVLSVRRANGY